LKDKNNIIDLVHAVLRGEEGSHKTLYLKYVKSMLINSKSIVGDIATAEDVVQESFVKAFQSLERLKNPENFASWLRSIVYRKSIDKLHKMNRSLVFEENVPETETDDELDFEGFPIEKLRMAINKLPSGCRSVLKMHVYEGLTHQEIGEYLGLSTSNSKSQYRYAIMKLQDQLIEKVGHEA